MAKNVAEQNLQLCSEIATSGILRTDSIDTNSRIAMRYLICILGLTGLAISQTSRSVINITITSMIHPDMAKKDNVSADGSCPWPIESPDASNDDHTSPSIDEINLEDNLSDESELKNAPDAIPNPISENSGAASDLPESYDQQVDIQPTTNSKISQDLEDKFKWTITEQQILLGGFFYSYFAFMIAGGWIAETYGAKYVLLTSVIGSGLINLATPWMARNNFILLVLSRIIMGAIQAGAFPAMYALFNEWLTMTEASIFAPLIKVSLRLGALFGTALSGLISEWPYVFYSTGCVCAIWCALWMFFATSKPEDNEYVSEIELAHIVRKKLNKLRDLEPGANSNQNRDTSTPWLLIITNPSVIALIIIKLTFNLAIDFIVIELPSYLKYVHHMSREKISAITSSILMIQTFLMVAVGWLAKTIVQIRPFGLTKTYIRKLFQSTASYGITLSVLLLTFNDCNEIYVIVLLQILSFLCMFTAGGETMLPYDLSEKYPATIMAVANSIANLSAVITTNLTPLILGNQGGSYDRWNLLLYIISLSNFIGATIFNLIVLAEPIDSIMP